MEWHAVVFVFEKAKPAKSEAIDKFFLNPKFFKSLVQFFKFLKIKEIALKESSWTRGLVFLDQNASIAWQKASKQVEIVSFLSKWIVSWGKIIAKEGFILKDSIEYFLLKSEAHIVAQEVTSEPEPEVVGTAMKFTFKAFEGAFSLREEIMLSLELKK